MSDGVLLIDTSGFLGNALSLRLINDGHSCIGYLESAPPGLGAFDNIHVGSLQNTEIMREILRRVDVTHISLDRSKFHFTFGWTAKTGLATGIQNT